MVLYLKGYNRRTHTDWVECHWEQ